MGRGFEQDTSTGQPGKGGLACQGRPCSLLRAGPVSLLDSGEIQPQLLTSLCLGMEQLSSHHGQSRLLQKGRPWPRDKARGDMDQDVTVDPGRVSIPVRVWIRVDVDHMENRDLGRTWSVRSGPRGVPGSWAGRGAQEHLGQRRTGPQQGTGAPAGVGCDMASGR